VFLAGAANADRVSGWLSQDFATPSAASHPVNRAILNAYGTGRDGYPQAVLVTLPAGATVDDPAAGRDGQASRRLRVMTAAMRTAAV
jgi:hypothetical protein